VFRQNEILSCFPTTQPIYINEQEVVYESEVNKLTFALVKADNDKEAIKLAERMVRDKKNG
jgi:hypothetical protein